MIIVHLTFFIGGIVLGWRLKKDQPPEVVLYKPEQVTPESDPPQAEEAIIIDRITPEVFAHYKEWKGITGGTQEEFFRKEYPQLL